jgi:hypothetical protein
LTAEDKLTPEIAAMTLRIASLMEGSNYQKLLEVMRRHETWQAWLDRLPESSRILYQNQIPLHEDRGILLAHDLRRIVRRGARAGADRDQLPHPSAEPAGGSDH